MISFVHAHGNFIIANLIFLLLSLSQNSISLLLPSIQEEMLLSANDQQWIINIPFVITTIFMTLLGKITDICNRMPIVRLSLLSFLLGNSIAALSTTFFPFFIGRMLQGFGAAVLLPQSYVLIKQGKRKANDILFSYFMGITTLFLIVGPGVAGTICALLGWRWVFWIGGIFSLFILLIAIYTPDCKTSEKKIAEKIDYLGALLMAVLSLSSIFCISTLSHSIFLLWGLVAVISLLFLKKHLGTCSWPIMDVTLFKRASLFVYTMVLCSMQITMASTYIVSFALQHIFNLNPAASGILLTITIAPSILVSFLSSYIQKRFRTTQIIRTSLVMLILGNLLIGCAGYYHTIHLLTVSRFIISFFISILLSVGMTVILNKVPIAQQGTVSSLVYQFREFSNMFCVAVMHAIAFCSQQSIQIMTGTRFALSMLIPTLAAFVALLFFHKNKGH
ncbi:MFS transporter [Candidatus Cardinium hertigii]|uniref:Multidrug efflux pump SdrM n=1 Tax=Candidatus Cardinium hertigii TaxID=247481 RepID=A0A2Z3L8M4_9BACT|nr:MFS transporter [Candidatus Cardinium hertigii]AWN81771.1 Multidrug efflux pump SdrM [Candidatus Cardinium hertigii]